MTGLRGWAIRHPHLRWGLPLALALGALAALVLTANPTMVVGVITRFRPVFLVPVIALSVGFYVLQGVRWWTLLRASDIRIRLVDTVLLTLSGQATALLPLGEATRSLLVARVTDSGVGSVVATETVQELLFVMVLFAAAIPGAGHYRVVLIGVVIALAVIALIAATLTLDPAFQVVHRLVARAPVVRRGIAGIDELRQYWMRLLRRRDTYAWLWISVLQAGMAITMLWLVVTALDPGKLSWVDAALTYAVTQGAGWLGLTPGGLGAAELSTAGFLVLLGLSYSLGAGTALLFRLADKGLATLIGLLVFAAIRRRYQLSGVSLLQLRQSGHGRRPPAPAAARG